MCSFCNRQPETILHLFYHCDKVKEFWLDLQKWLKLKANITFHMTIKSILFFKEAYSVVLNHIVILAKYYIYRTKFFTNSINMVTFIAFLKKKFQNEKYISKLHNNYDKFLAKWSALYHTLDEA